MKTELLEKWHTIIRSGDMEELDSLLDDDVMFYSPVVFTPQRGKTITKRYLQGAYSVLVSDDFVYINEAINDHLAVMEFETKVDGLYVNGVDMISWSEQGKITEFKVMVRPLKAVDAVHKAMERLLY